MQILIIGAGAMGGLFGSLLSRVAQVTLFDTSNTHVDAINTKGLTVTGQEGKKEIFSIKAISQPDQYKTKSDVAIIFTKCHATTAAAHTARRLLAPNGIVLTLQNGIGNLEQLVTILGPDRVTAGVTSQAGTFVKPGHIHHAGSGPTYFASTSSQMHHMEIFAACCNKAGIPAEISDNVDSLIWGKLIINVGINALAAILRVPNGILGITPECEQLMKQAVEEAMAVAQAKDIPIPYKHPLEKVKEVCTLTAENRASMLQDTLGKRPTEIEAINGAIVTLGEETGIPTPTNTFITQIIKAMQATTAHRL